MVNNTNTEKFAPIVNYANHSGWSDIEPYEIIGRSPSGKQLTLRQMKAVRDPEWKPNIIPGGFSGICVNNSEQRWIIEPDESGFVIKARLSKYGNGMRFHSKLGWHTLSTVPVKHHDYNF